MNSALTVILGFVVMLNVWAIVFIVRPLTARARFVATVTSLRDGCDDAIILGELPAVGPAPAFVSKADGFIDQVRTISFTTALSWHDAGVSRFEVRHPSYGECSTEGRALLHKLDKQLTAAIATLLVNGSSLWWLLPLLKRWTDKRRHVDVRAHYTSTSVAGPRELAEEYNRAADESGRPMFA